MVNNDLLSLANTRPLKFWQETLALLCSVSFITPGKDRVPFVTFQCILTATYLFEAVVGSILLDQFKGQVTVTKFIAEQIIFCIGSFAVFLCWN